MSHIHLALESLPSGVFFSASSFLRRGHVGGLHDSDGGIQAHFVGNHQPTTAIVRQFPTFRRSVATNGWPQPSSPSYLPAPKPLAAPTDRILCLPLLDVTVDVRVEGTISRTTLTQLFTNLDPTTHIPEAHYTFPLYDGAAITSFRCYIGDSTVFAGVVKPKEVAKQVYRRAIEKMETAALLEEHTPEVFETLLGNIPPSTSVKIELTYVSELKIDQGEKGGVLVTVPTSVAPRYGAPPEGYTPNSNSKVNEAGLSIVVTVTAPGPIQKVECRTHPVSVEMGMLEEPETTVVSTFSGLAGQGDSKAKAAYTAIARLTNPHATMDRDFVLHILASTRKIPSDGRVHSRAMLSPVNGSGHAALMLSLRPSELFESFTTTSFGGEIVFLADRSGSMDGMKIQALREALVVFLKSLPLGCTFNIVSFGSHFQSMWDCSRSYSQDAVDEAIACVESFAADMGGTELLPALTEVVRTRDTSERSSSTQIIVLTDGEVWKTEQTINFVRGQRRELGDKIRFFALGIGNRVSHRLIEGIGSEGGGLGEVCGVDTQGDWKERVITMLKAALAPSSWACKFDLGDEYTSKTLMTDSFFNDELEGAVLTPASPSYICAPHSCPPIHHYALKSVFFLLKPGASALPATVTIRATGRGMEESIALVDVEETIRDARTIQHLAARASLLDFEGDNHSTGRSDIIRDNAERIGEIYSVASRWTSFVAVDQSSNDLREINSYRPPVSSSAPPMDDLSWLTMPTPKSLELSRQGIRLPPGGQVISSPAAYVQPDQALRRVTTSQFGSVIKISREWSYCEASIDSTSDHSPESTSDVMCSEPELQGLIDFEDSSSSFDPVPVPTGGSSLVPSNEEWGVPKRSLNCLQRASLDIRDSSKQIAGSRETRPAIRMPVVHYPRSRTPSPTPTWSDILAAQSADGFFSLSLQLLLPLSRHFCPGTRDKFLSDIPSNTVEEREQAARALETGMVIIYIHTHFAEKRNLWSLMMEKAKSQVETRLEELGLWEKLEKSMQCAHRPLIKAYNLPPDIGCEVCNYPKMQATTQCHQCNDGKDMTLEELWKHQAEQEHWFCPLHALDMPDGHKRQTSGTGPEGKDKKVKVGDMLVEQNSKGQVGASSGEELETKTEGTENGRNTTRSSSRLLLRLEELV